MNMTRYPIEVIHRNKWVQNLRRNYDDRKLINENEVIEKGKRAKIASYEMNMKTTVEKNEALKDC